MGDNNPWLIDIATTVADELAAVANIAVPTNSSMAIQFIVSGIDGTGTNFLYSSGSGGAWRQASAATAFSETTVNSSIQGSVFQAAYGDSSVTPPVICTAAGANLLVQVQGIAGETIKWKCSYHYITQGV